MVFVSMETHAAWHSRRTVIIAAILKGWFAVEAHGIAVQDPFIAVKAKGIAALTVTDVTTYQRGRVKATE